RASLQLNWHPETDSLYFDRSERLSIENRAIAEGIGSIMTLLDSSSGSTATMQPRGRPATTHTQQASGDSVDRFRLT
ncbi:MAG: hypothetical protein NNA18_11330, partial [Nitrospira sp.]|nr:hypothetical protein [Nitrospira sp.]